MTVKKNSRTARKRKAQAAGVEPTVAQVFREVEEAVTRDYLETKKYLRGEQERILAQIQDTFWRDGKFLKKCREEIKDFSQEQLAEVTEISRLVIANYESGVTLPTAENAYKIYQALDTLGGGIGTLRALVEILHLSATVKLAHREMLRGRLESIKAVIAKLDAETEIGDSLEKYKARLTEMAIAEAQAKAAKR